MEISCVYAIKNLINNKLYIGSAVNFVSRRKNHRKRLRKNTHPNKHLQTSWNKYGEKSFEFFILEIVSNKTRLIEREQYWIDFYKSYLQENGYNKRIIAQSNLGLHILGGFKKGLIPWNKGLKLPQFSGENHGMYGKSNPYKGKHYKTLCINGHEKSEENLSADGFHCRLCDNERSRKRNKTEIRKTYMKTYYLTHKEKWS